MTTLILIVWCLSPIGFAVGVIRAAFFMTDEAWETPWIHSRKETE